MWWIYTSGYIPLSGTITIASAVPAAANPNNINKNVVFKNFFTLTVCIRAASNTELENATDIDVVVLISNLIKYSSNYSKTAILWQYYWDEPFLNDNDIVSFFCCY